MLIVCHRARGKRRRTPTLDLWDVCVSDGNSDGHARWHRGRRSGRREVAIRLRCGTEWSGTVLPHSTSHFVCTFSNLGGKLYDKGITVQSDRFKKNLSSTLLNISGVRVCGTSENSHMRWQASQRRCETVLFELESQSCEVEFSQCGQQGWS